jgi:hypothetical protein
MYGKKRFLVFKLVFFVSLCLTAQTHTAVPLGDPVYHILEQAQMRGLCRFLPSAKPYSRAFIISVIDEIFTKNETLGFGRLTESEGNILRQYRTDLSPGKEGFDMVRGAYFTDHLWDDSYFSGEFGFGFDLFFAGGYYPEGGGFRKATDSMLSLSVKGDLGKGLSYGLAVNGGVFMSPRNILGEYHTYYAGFNDGDDGPYPDSPWYKDRILTAYSEPVAYFPYTYKKKWDGSVWYTSDVSNSGHQGWPQNLSIGYSMIPELSGEFLNGHIFYRIARLDREWGGMTNNGSLILNQSAQPFLAGEITFAPFKWLSFSSLTGVLEYNNTEGIKNSAETSQNAFSIVMLELNYDSYMHMDFGSTAVWPKRFELGYIFPIMDNFLYQNNIGDFDNMAFFLNVQGQYPGLGKLWFSFFLDEANPDSEFFRKSKEMYAFQLGASARIPWLPFSSLTVSYTKNEPYNYTHIRESVPWYGELPMETNYVNNGKSLGYYIPPNSDEILVRVDAMPTLRNMVSLQYQLIRHGADYGDRAVGGSSFMSELDPRGRNEKPNLRKFFLHDGAYQWTHIFKFTGEYSFAGFNMPVKLYCEIGGVYSYFTDIDGEVNSGSKPYSVIDTPVYPHSFGFIGVFGVKLFPK